MIFINKIAPQMKDYAREKREKKKAALKVIWIIGLMGVLFLVIVSRFAMAGSDDINNGSPSNDDVYAMAKRFVRPTLQSVAPEFHDGYKFRIARDSVYVIRSYAETNQHGETEKTNFEIVLKYKGGPFSAKENWEMLNLNED
jgi:hypothetical protein